MKKEINIKTKEPEMRREYDFSNLRPNKYARKYAKGSNIVIIEPDLVEFFPDSASVNAALRALVSTFPKSRTRRKAKKSSQIKQES